MSDVLNEVRAAVDSGNVRVADLAQRVGRTRATVYRYLSGHIDPPLSVSMELVAACRPVAVVEPAVVEERDEGEVAADP